jgi:hypothetical protein
LKIKKRGGHSIKGTFITTNVFIKRREEEEEEEEEERE